MVDEILEEIMAMEMGDTATFKITDTRFLFVDNWNVGDGDDFTSLELNSGVEEDGKYVLDEVLECGTCDFGNVDEINSALCYIIQCVEDELKNLKAINIIWDVDCDEDLEDLPTEIRIPKRIMSEDEISDYISDVTGFCHKGYELVEE